MERERVKKEKLKRTSKNQENETKQRKKINPKSRPKKWKTQAERMGGR
jgi:hypothetical protein